MAGCSVRCHAGDSSDVTLAFEDSQVIPPFSKEETENTEDTDDIDDTDYTDATDDTDNTFWIHFGYFWDTFRILLG